MDQLFVDRVVAGVRRIKLPPARRAPSCVVFGHAPLEYDLDRFPWRNLRCDLWRNGNLAIRLEFASEVSRLHYSFLTSFIISRVRTARRACACAPVSECGIMRREARAVQIDAKATLHSGGSGHLLEAHLSLVGQQRSTEWRLTCERKIAVAQIRALVRDHSDCLEPRLHQLRHFRYRQCRPAQPKCMTAMWI